MIIPLFWASASRTHRADKRQFTVQRWGWSSQSQQAAQAHADARADQALDRVIYEWPSPTVLKREPKTPYNGAEGVPIREEVLEDRGDVVVTRNAYGAMCLNASGAMFVDIDRDQVEAIPKGSTPATIITGLILGVIAWRMAGWQDWALYIPPAIGLAFILRALLWRAMVMARGGAPAIVERALDREIDRDPNSAWAVYQTPAGWRLLALHRQFDPSAPETADMMRRLQVDRLYLAMCRRQKCFRARVSPKPWRMDGFERLRGPTWPIDGVALQRRREWVDSYDLVRERYSSCRLLRLQGNLSRIDPGVQEVKNWHDDLSGATTDLPMA